MLIVEVVVAVVVGVFLVGVYRDAKNGTLPLQNSVGIKNAGNNVIRRHMESDSQAVRSDIPR